jgi:hypothetical protein
MKGAEATDISFRDVSWPSRARFHCEDLDYSRIEVTEKGRNALMEWPRKAAYAPTMYTELASYLDTHGDPGGAKKVRFDNHLDELGSLGFWHVPGNIFFLVTVGYGEYPVLAFGWMALFVGFGFFPFRNTHMMELIDPDKPPPHYNPLWYSLGLFLPAVDIGEIHAWRPRKGCRFARNYAHIHVLAGWIFVPVALVALTGLFK